MHIDYVSCRGQRKHSGRKQTSWDKTWNTGPFPQTAGNSFQQSRLWTRPHSHQRQYVCSVRFKSLVFILHCFHWPTVGQSIGSLAILPFWRNILTSHGDSVFPRYKTHGETFRNFSKNSVKDKACVARIKKVI